MQSGLGGFGVSPPSKSRAAQQQVFFCVCAFALHLVRPHVVAAGVAVGCCWSGHIVVVVEVVEFVFDVMMAEVVVWAAGVLSMRKRGYAKSRCKHTGTETKKFKNNNNNKQKKHHKPQFSMDQQTQ